MYLVPLPEIAVPVEPDPGRERILICNGHTRAHTQPAMDGWFGSRRQQLGRDFQFIGMDATAQWLQRDRLVNEFRVAPCDLGRSVEGLGVSEQMLQSTGIA
jgi:hypothetical protein